MRRLLITSLIVLLAAVLLPAIAHARTTFIVTGFGWGHGVGMSQYGAYGLAQQGASFDAILATYYPGTTLAPVDPTVVRVLLASERASIKLASPSPYTVTDGAGVVHELPAGSTRIKRDFSVITSDGKLALTGPLRFAGGEDPLAWERPYRGAMIVTEEGGRLRLINEVGLESYLYGVVPSEMSPSWDAEALKAQAVAARSFALSTRGSDDDFELFADTRSQVYRGRDVEHESTTAAVDATSGLALYYEGRIASTFFSASSGGRTAAIEDVFLGSAPVPYLRAVDDPTDRVSPFFRWGPIALSSRQLGAQLGPPGPGHPLDATVQKNASGRVGLLVVAGRKKQAAVDGPTARTRLGLRSTGFDVAVASLRSLPRRVIYGEKALV
ncbi:MAG: SpoIID/LytB domain-containing protein, partial [Gaiellales bacterium]